MQHFFRLPLSVASAAALALASTPIQPVAAQEDGSAADLNASLSYDEAFDTRFTDDIKYRFGSNGYGTPSIAFVRIGNTNRYKYGSKKERNADGTLMNKKGSYWNTKDKYLECFSWYKSADDGLMKRGNYDYACESRLRKEDQNQQCEQRLCKGNARCHEDPTLPNQCHEGGSGWEQPRLRCFEDPNGKVEEGKWKATWKVCKGKGIAY